MLSIKVCDIQDAATQYERAVALAAVTPRPQVPGSRIVAPTPASVENSSAAQRSRMAETQVIFT